MALRSKTVEYAFPTLYTGSVISLWPDPAGTTSSMMIYIPETGSRTFLSCRHMLFGRESHSGSGARQSIEGWSMASSVNNSPITLSKSTTTAFTSTSEHQTFHFTNDITNNIVNAFGNGSSGDITCSFSYSCSMTAGGAANTVLPLVNLSQKLFITYQYDDVNTTTRIKTVRLPLESANAGLGNSSNVIALNQIPALDTFLPESSKVYRDIWIELQGNESVSSATGTPFRMTMSLDNEVYRSTGFASQAASSCVLVDYIWPRLNMDTSKTHSLVLLTSNTNNPYTNICPTLYVTYEYNHDTSTNILNSCILPFNMPQQRSRVAQSVPDYRTADDYLVQPVSFYIEEPQPIQLVMSAARWMWMTGNTAGLRTKIGSQTSYRTVNDSAGAVTIGNYMYQQRFDSGSNSAGSGSSMGAGITLQRGLNTLNISAYCATSNLYAGGGLVLLNYTSSKSIQGDAVHNHSVFHSFKDKNSLSNELVNTASAPVIPDSKYYIQSVGGYWYPTFTGVLPFTQALAIVVDMTGSFGPEYNVNTKGSLPVVGWCHQGDNRWSGCEFVHDFTSFFNCYSGSREGKMNLTTPRKWRLPTDNASNSYCTDWALWTTYHSILFNISGTLSRYSGSGDGITTDFHRTSDDKYLFSLTSSIGGGVTGSWYDNTEQIYGTAYQDSTKMGRSLNFTASGEP